MTKQEYEQIKETQIYDIYMQYCSPEMLKKLGLLPPSKPKSRLALAREGWKELRAILK